jgi:hypothetical protein
VAYQFQLAERHWLTFTRGQVGGNAVGLADGGRPVRFDFSEPHSLVAGTTNAGKSEALKSILHGLVTSHEPAELGLLILDPHRDLEAFERSAHLVAPVAHNREEIARGVTWFCRELADRKAENRRDGRRLVIVADEGPEAFKSESGAILNMATETARQCRKFRMSFLVGSQDNKREALGSLPDLLLNRWIGLVRDARTSAQLSGLAGLDAHRLTGRGDFWHLVGATCERLQVAMATESDLAEIPRAVDVPELEAEPLDAVPELGEGEGDGRGRPPIQPDPATVAFYLYHGFAGEVVSVRAAGRRGITRTMHDVNGGFAEEIREYLDQYDLEGGVEDGE